MFIKTLFFLFCISLGFSVSIFFSNTPDVTIPHIPAQEISPAPLETPPLITEPIPEILPEKILKEKAYTSLTLTSFTSLLELEKKIGKEYIDTVLRINRLDSEHLSKNTTLVIPSDMSDYMTLSPFPKELPEINTIPKIIFVSQKIQAFAAYEYGKQILWGPVSSGKKSTPTPNNLYFANWKAKRTISTSNDTWILNWNVNIENHLGISLHQYDLPGYPASHSCIRLLEADALWVYNWIDQWELSKNGQIVLVKGTPVIIFGEYDYKETPPWKLLPENEYATIIPSIEITNLISMYKEELFPEITENSSL